LINAWKDEDQVLELDSQPDARVLELHSFDVNESSLVALCVVQSHHFLVLWHRDSELEPFEQHWLSESFVEGSFSKATMLLHAISDSLFLVALMDTNVAESRLTYFLFSTSSSLPVFAGSLSIPLLTSTEHVLDMRAVDGTAKYLLLVTSKFSCLMYIGYGSQPDRIAWIEVTFPLSGFVLFQVRFADFVLMVI
jgi:hypothetical protein